MMKLALAAAMALLLGTGVVSQPLEGVPLLRTVPADVTTIDTYYKQDVYTVAQEKIGEIADLLVDKEGVIRVAIVSVGGFLGLPSKYVAAPFSALQLVPVERKQRVILDTTQLALKRAPGFKYDRTNQRWKRAEDE